jgi:SAM-dependent methyltransferase
MTTTTQTTAEIDAAKTEAFVGQLLTDLAGAATAASVVIGDRTGLYRAMTGAGPLKPEALAARAGANPRLVREWLSAQAVSGYVTYDAADGTFELPMEHAAVLALPESPAYVIGAVEIVAGQFTTLDRFEAAIRGDGGIPYGAFPASLHTGIERYFATAYRHQLADVWFPAVDGLVERLAAGARVADVGCGHGASTLLMGQLWPNSTFTGIDSHQASIVTARARAIEAGSPENVTFTAAEAGEAAGGPYDVVIFFDALHDMGDPPAVLRHTRDLLADGGIVLAVEPWSVDVFQDGIGDPRVRLSYAISTSLCTPNSLAQPGAYGLGTQGGPTRRIELFAEAGFRDARLAADTGFNLVIAARK